MSETRIFIAGHNGMVGSALFRLLEKQKNTKLITRKKNDLNLINQSEVLSFFKDNKIDQVYLAAAKVGGIYANNTFPGEFIYENLMIQSNIIHSSFLAGVKKLLFLGSSCIYPKLANQPMKENELLTGLLEPSNEPYAIAKIAGIKLCESYNRQYHKKYGIDYRSIMPTNLYGPGDNYHPENSHVIPSLIRRFHEAKLNNSSEVFIWGTGNQKREFLFVDDMAQASIHLMNLEKNIYDQHTNPMNSHINAGSGIEFTIKNLAKHVSDIVGFKGKIIMDPSKPDGSPRKLMNSEILNNLGWSPKTGIKEGLKIAYKDFLKI